MPWVRMVITDWGCEVEIQFTWELLKVQVIQQLIRIRTEIVLRFAKGPKPHQLMMDF